ncbi:sugar ABC transporter permease [Paenibacillaceae bacterium]|nr:sugar ABC transporter permease [Paenibacillaceae bacterium]
MTWTADAKHRERGMPQVKMNAITKNYELYLLLLPTTLYFIIFYYWPMYGLQIAFKDFIPSLGITGSAWVGLKHFVQFFDSFYFWTLIKNTIGISLYTLIVAFPIPIVLALMVNEVSNSKFKKFVQTVTYAPHFISTVVLVSIVILFLSPQTGIVNNVIQSLGFESVDFLSRPEWFKSIYVFSGIWQTVGWGSIIYIAALAGIDPQTHEAAIMDGATRLQRIWHINIPGILPTIVILLILEVGGIMSVGFEKVYLMQNPLNMEGSDIIQTYVYRRGIQGAQYSFATAVGLFNACINFVLLFMINRIAKSLKQASLW